MESLNKKSTTGISGGLSFASAAAAGANKPATTTPAAAAPNVTTTTTGPAKNGGAASGAASAASSSPALGSQSPAPSGTEPKVAAATTTNPTTVAATTINANSNNGAIDWVLGMNVKVVTLADEVFEGQVYAYDVIMNCVCPSKSVSAAATPTAYYSPSLGNSNSNNNSNNGTNGNAGARLKYDFRILKINYIKDVTPLLSSAGSTSTVTTPTTTPTIPAAGQNHNGQSNNNSIPSSEANSTSEDNSNNNITNNIYSTVLPAVGYVQLDKIQQREQQAIREAQAAAARIGVGVSTIGQDIFDALSKTLPCRWHKDQIVVMDEVIISSPYEPDNCKANASAAATLARVKKVLEGERMRMANGRK
ncbi:MAG: anticodon-binding domain-containing protein [Linnemannia elongata]|nr:MAG: anticodon-binding domain-containing protein [Linnemannia elongata]